MQDTILLQYELLIEAADDEDHVYLTFRILQQACNRTYRKFESTHDLVVSVYMEPDITSSCIWLRGTTEHKDYQMERAFFVDESDAVEYASRMQAALREWANHGGFFEPDCKEITLCNLGLTEPLREPEFGIITLTQSGLVW